MKSTCGHSCLIVTVLPGLFLNNNSEHNVSAKHSAGGQGATIWQDQKHDDVKELAACLPTSRSRVVWRTDKVGTDSRVKFLASKWHQ